MSSTWLRGSDAAESDSVLARKALGGLTTACEQADIEVVVILSPQRKEKLLDNYQLDFLRDRVSDLCAERGTV